MDQDAFRHLLSTSTSSTGGTKPSFSASRNVFSSGRGGFGKKVAGHKANKEKEEAAAPLKPRKLKPTVAEAPVEKTQLHSLLRDLTGHEVDDDAHPGSARGLDLSLIARARAEAAQVDDAADEDALEAAFATGTSGNVPSTDVPAATEKKTRSEILAQLKASRVGSSVPAEAEPSQSKFRPIGFKPIGTDSKKKTKKKAQGALDGERKKKRRKAEEPSATASSSTLIPTSASAVAVPPTIANTPKHTVSALEQAPLDDDGDIFADVGEYEGVDLDGTDDEDAEKPLEAERNHTPVASSEGPKRAGGWFGEQPPLETPVNEGERTDHTEDPPPAPPPEVPPVPDGEDEEHVRLRPLASSTVPSIREMLAADDALAADEKRRARKEKRKKA